MTEWTFEVRGRLVGHKCSPRAAHGKPFLAFKRTVRLLANVAGVPSDLDQKGAYRVDTEISFRLKAHTDAENIRKAIIDALWDRDRRVLSGSYNAIENMGRESVVIRIARIF